MQVNINSTGVLTVTSESPIEAYALKKWLKDWENSESALYIDTGNQYNPSAVSLFYVDKK